jgi:hypothetical protein
MLATIWFKNDGHSEANSHASVNFFGFALAAGNGPKYFSAAELEDLRRNLKWLAKASDAIVGYW